jgi:hypothetical protein
VIDPIASHALVLSVFGLQTGLLIAILRRRVWRRFAGPFLYVLLMLSVDFLLRPLFLQFYGIKSHAYYVLYSCTGAALRLASVLMACSFSHRAGREDRRARALYVVLAGIMVLTALPHLLGAFQYRRYDLPDLYFACEFLRIVSLVICALLWIVLRSAPVADTDLKLLVAGLAVLLGGYTIRSVLGAFADSSFSDVLNFLSGICTLMSLSLWWKAVVLASSPAPHLNP